MTEAEWIGGADPLMMMAFLRGRVSNRKLRLYALAGSKPPVVPSPECDQVHALAERYADGEASESEVAPFREQPGIDRVAQFWWFEGRRLLKHDAHEAATECLEIRIAARWVQIEAGMPGMRLDLAGQWEYFTTTEPDQFWSYENPEAVPGQVDTIRDVVGNPFRPVTFSPAWRTNTVLSLARTMYESRDFSAMPILADALQDAGCDNDDVLSHCRGAGPHVRGCWVCDLVLGKA
jgi:hypothetical protein